MFFSLRRILLLLVSAAALLAAGATAHAQLPLLSDEKPAYEVAFEGVDNPELRALLEQSSLLVELQTTPADVAALKRRAREDLPRLRGALRSRGYYDAGLKSSVSDGEPPKVVINIETGPLYLLGAYEVVAQGCDEADCAPAPVEEDLDLVLGEPALAAAIAAADAAVRNWYRRRGHAFPEVEPQKVVVDHQLRGVFVTQVVRPGLRHTLGTVLFRGDDGGVSQDYLRRLRTWKPGAQYDSRRLREYRDALQNTSLFQGVEVEPVRRDQDAGIVDVAVTLAPAKVRSIGGGVGYATDIGPKVSAFWRHRNILGADEDLEFRTTVSEPKQELVGSFRKPSFLRKDQDLLASSSVFRDDTDAFESTGIKGEIGLERRVTASLRTGISGLAEVSRIEDADGERNVYLLGLPLAVTHDNRDNALDPTEGWFASARATPFTGEFDGPRLFGKVEVSASYYYDDLPIEGLVAAVRGKLGSIYGEDTENIPATRRFYSGGGGSVRGYEFQSVGPLDGATDPLGGRSVLEFGAELRFRVYGDFGVVPFVDAGTVGDDPYPDLGDELLWAAGLGLRYYTTIGPARFDLAFPINGRKGIDDSFQFYLSLGQAF